MSDTSDFEQPLPAVQALRFASCSRMTGTRSGSYLGGVWRWPCLLGTRSSCPAVSKAFGAEVRGNNGEVLIGGGSQTHSGRMPRSSPMILSGPSAGRRSSVRKVRSRSSCPTMPRRTNSHSSAAAPRTESVGRGWPRNL